MAIFSGADVVELAFDFTKWLPVADPEVGYKPGKTVVPEPTNIQIAAYFGAFGAMMRESARRMEEWQARLGEATEQHDDARVAAIEDEFTVWEAKNTEEMFGARRDLLAALCSDVPAAALLAKLPGRVFTGFENYVQTEITGKE